MTKDVFAQVASDQAIDAVRRLETVALPAAIMGAASVCSTLLVDWGYLKSFEAGQAIDGKGRPLPLYSYSAIEYLIGLDLRSARVLEFGSGFSTLFWAMRSASVTALESSLEWFEKINNVVPEHAKVIKVDDYTRADDRWFSPDAYDIVIVDCAANRYQCSKIALQCLNKTGFVVLDNSDWYPNSSALLRNANLIEIDFHGPRPCHHYTATTSLFLRRGFDFKPAGTRQPLPPIGGKAVTSADWDSDQ